MLLESKEYVEEIDLNRLKLDFLSLHPCVSETSLSEFVQQILISQPSSAPNLANEADWGFAQSVFFAVTLVTTIGYGQMSPLSVNGKLFCIFYSVMGIPLTLILFNAYTDRLLRKSNILLKTIIRKFSLENEANVLKMKLFYLFGLLLFLSSCFIFIPAYLFTQLESDWSYLDSLYYCFITLTTIGLGDYIPGESAEPTYRSTYKIIVSVYIILSLLSTVFVLKTFYEIPELKIMKIFALRLDEPNQFKNVSEYQILFGHDDNGIRNLYSQDFDQDVQPNFQSKI